MFHVVSSPGAVSGPPEGHERICGPGLAHEAGPREPSLAVTVETTGGGFSTGGRWESFFPCYTRNKIEKWWMMLNWYVIYMFNCCQIMVWKDFTNYHSLICDLFVYVELKDVSNCINVILKPESSWHCFQCLRLRLLRFHTGWAEFEEILFKGADPTTLILISLFNSLSPLPFPCEPYIDEKWNEQSVGSTEDSWNIQIPKALDHKFVDISDLKRYLLMCWFP